MRMNNIRHFLAIVGVTASLAACNTVETDPESMLEKREKEGRIALVLGENQLEIDPSLVERPITIPPQQTITAWPQSGGNSDKGSVNANAAQNLRVAWSTQAGAGSDLDAAISAPPISDGSRVYVLDAKQTVHAVSVANGASLWSKRLTAVNASDKVASGGGLAVSGDRLIVSSGYGFVSAISAQTGADIWRRAIGTPVSGAPTLLDGAAYVITNNNEVYALDIATGSVLWSEQGFAESARLLASPSPAAIEDIVIVPYSSGEVTAYLTANGRRLWVDSLDRGNQFTPISTINDIPGRPVLGVGQRIYVSNQSGLTAAIDARTGDRVWEQPIGSTQTPALIGDTLFVAGLGGQIAAIDAIAGGVHWIANLPAFSKPEDSKGRIVYLGPLVTADRMITIGSDGVLHALDPLSGAVLTTLNLGQEAYVEPIMIGDKILLYTDAGRLIAID